MFSSHQIRQKYLEYFRKNGHAVISSASLLPENDPTTLFTSSGMQPLVPYLLGQKHPSGDKLVNSQKCFRANDIEDVGDNRHTTFFEMLGNWSLGSYFKKEQIPWIFRFVTEELSLDPNRLYVTVFRGNTALGIPRDEEAVALWKKAFASRDVAADDQDFAECDGMKETARIFYYDEQKNWWSRAGIPSNMPVDEPGGPDTEMFWDFGEELGLHEKWVNEVPARFHNMHEGRSRCHVNCDCGRFMELGNSVFMQYKKTEAGFEELPQKNVDFGGGLERLSAAVNDTPDIFLIELFSSAMKTLESLAQSAYSESEIGKHSYRVILDHLRAAMFLVSDGASPSNKDWGYFTRRLIRRAIRYAQKIGITQNFCSVVVAEFINTYSTAYSNLHQQREKVLFEIEKEEEKFRKTLTAGLKMFEQEIKQIAHGAQLSGVTSFDLYQTYGFPIELTQELAGERGVSVDMVVYAIEQQKHQDLSRAGATQKFAGGLADHSEKTIRGHTATHLLHKALRNVLGTHVLQKGSNITPERIRFDFSHPSKMTQDEIRRVEDMVNEQVHRQLPVSWEILPIEVALKKNAIGVFEEKYGDTVKVYTVGDFSKEVCGGPHVNNTREVGRFKIVKEETVSAGIRRIKAVLD